MEPKYYECHVTVEPVFEERLETLKQIASEYGFRVADLLMKRRKLDTEMRSSKDSFCTARDIDFSVLKLAMVRFVQRLKDENFQVWRQKIEAVLIDERTKPAS